MINKKTIAVNQVLASRGLPVILSQIGRVYEIPFTDGRKTLGVILTSEGVRGLGIDLKTVFKDCGGREEFVERTDVKYGSTSSPQAGVLVNLDLYQQVTILRAIITIKPELADVLGLYNLRGSRKVYEILSEARVSRQLDISWMWTGEEYIEGQKKEATYPEEGIMTLSSLPTLEGARFAFRYIVNGPWYNNSPSLHTDLGAVIFGAQI